MNKKIFMTSLAILAATTSSLSSACGSVATSNPSSVRTTTSIDAISSLGIIIHADGEAKVKMDTDAKASNVSIGCINKNNNRSVNVDSIHQISVKAVNRSQGGIATAGGGAICDEKASIK